MVFKADDVAIRTFGRRFEELINDAERAVGYVNDALTVNSGSTGIFVHVAGTAEAVRQALTANHSHLAMIVDLSASELAAAANLYRDTDGAGAGEIDSAYQPSARRGPL
ncbi:hypothetical protein Q0Z83_063170 [Actinoplanes sichuanensis]|uniref:Excreted virulence factor EspC, type VII ESX diderm n=1 Tax=Actinoplanes sichuanensis TaxID=512349 RepID=A0ABW3ZZB9_9ACTN|nr:hypothetical protein [Actinoplanes sichuanensis]BEL08126.1 hypothetical protein Q0Z83_063170 [Actinoplanes sichuanensis]